MLEEFFCPYCKLWITDNIHRQHFHNDLDAPDDVRDWRRRIDGVVYDDDVMEGDRKARGEGCL